MRAHSAEVNSMVSRLLEAGTLRALQVAAVHSSLCVAISSMAASGLQHLALACERLRLERGWSSSSAPPLPSIHLFTWVRPDGAAWVLDTRSLRPPHGQCSKVVLFT